MHGHRERGATLVELQISIVVVAVAASAVLGVVSSSAGRSADAMVLAQATSIARRQSFGGTMVNTSPSSSLRSLS
jgi:type II secretory pathway pseudopilin PulG